MEDTAVINACATMKVWHLYRQVDVNLEADAAKEYFDDSGNFRIGEEYLNIATVSSAPSRKSETVQVDEGSNRTAGSQETKKKPLLGHKGHGCRQVQHGKEPECGFMDHHLCGIMSTCRDSTRTVPWRFAPFSWWIGSGQQTGRHGGKHLWKHSAIKVG